LEKTGVKPTDKVKYCLLEQTDWETYPMFDTIEEAYEHKYTLEDEKPTVYMLDPISVVVYYEKS